MANSSNQPMEWKFSQVFGEEQGDKAEEIQEADLLSAICFDETGDYLATGDKGGRIVVFERAPESKVQPPTTTPARRASKDQPQVRNKVQNCQYRFLTEFQSHEPEFDYLKSLEIEEKINAIRWCKGGMGSKMLLSTNDKTIKLWKIYGKKIKTVSNMNVEPQANHYASNDQQRNIAEDVARLRSNGLRIPQMNTCEKVVTATPKRIFSNAHAYHINSISLNSDGETFVSCDDLRVNLWNLNISSESFNIVDIKPSNMEALSEVITSTDFHPSHCNIFLYSSSRGCVRMADMRCQALCDDQAKVFEEPEDPSNKSFFSEIISSISNACFSGDGRYIVSRDYMSLKLWDVNMESRPLKTFPIHEHLRSKLCDLYENDCIFDKFEVTFSHDNEYLLTGSYQNTYHVISRDGSKPDHGLEASKTPNRRRSLGTPKKSLGSMGRSRLGSTANEPIDFTKRILHAAFHPHQNVIAVAATSTLYIFKA